MHPRRTLTLLPCLLVLLCLTAAAPASASMVSLFSVPTSCLGAAAGGLTAATDTTTAPTGWQPSDVTVNLTGANVTGWEWMVDCGPAQSGPAGSSVVFNVSGAHVLSHRAHDVGGIWTDWTDDVVQIDKTPPINTTSVPSTWSATPVTVNVTGVDTTSSVAQVQYDRGDGTGAHTGTAPQVLNFSGDGVYTLITSVQDAAGNWSTPRTDHVQIDGTAPVDDTVTPSGWQYTATSITVTGHDAGAGVSRVDWRVDGVQSSGANGASVSIPDGTHLLETRIVDAAGNASGWAPHTVMVDTTGPQDTTSVSSLWQSAPYVDVPITGVDPNGSGIGEVDWELDGVPGSFTGASRTVRVSGDADHVLRTRVVDHGGDDSGWTTRHVKIDMVQPTDTTTASGGWQRAPLDVVVGASDALSGPEHVEWQLDGSGTQSATGATHTVNIAGDGVHTLLTRVFDGAGNVTGWKTTTVLIDASAPRNTTPTASTAWRSSSYSVTLSGDDDVSGIAQVNYKIDGGTTHSGPSGFTNAVVSGEGSHTLQTWATDVAGNTSAPRSETINIDSVAPADTTTAPAGAVANHYPVAVTGSDSGSGVSVVEWMLDGGAVQSGTSGTVVTIDGGGTHHLQTKVVDNAGNDSGWKTITITVDLSLTLDTTAPTDTSTSLSTAWRTAAVTVTVAATDAGVGVDHVEWRLNGQAIQRGPSGTTVTLADEGDNEIETRAIDLAGNASGWRDQIVRIDTVVPVDTTTLPVLWANTRTFTLGGTDVTSGVADVEYSLDGAATQTVASGGAVTFASDGSHTLKRRVVDVAGQASAWVTKTIKIDTVLPVNTSAAAPTAWQTSPAGLSLALSGTDAASGPDHAEWQIDGGATQSGSPALVTADGVHTLETRELDVAGNASAWRSETVKIDHTAPTNLTPVPAAAWQSTNYSATVSGDDATSGVARVEWTLDGGATQTTPSVTISASGPHTLVSRVLDLAGNASAWRTDAIGIDKVVPTLTVDCGSVDWRSTAATCSVTADGGPSGLGTLTAAEGAGAAVPVTDGTYTVGADGTTSLTFRAVDGAGNEKLALAQVKVDRTPPSATVSCTPGAGTSYVCAATGADALSGLSALSWSVDGAGATAISSGGTFAVQHGLVTVSATDRAGNVASSAPLRLATRSTSPAGSTSGKKTPTPRSTSEAVLKVGKGSIGARALGEVELAALPASTTAVLRPLALGKGRFQVTFTLTADRKSKTYNKTISTRSGYSPQITLKLGGALSVRVKLTVKRRSGSHWATLATGSAKL